MGNKSEKWSSRTVIELQRDGIILVEDGNHGEYRPRPNEFSTIGTSFIRAADMAGGRVLFESAQKISDIAMQRIRKGIGAGGDVILSHKGTVGKVAYVPLDAQPFVCSPQTTFWRTLDNDKIDRRYLFSFLNSQNFKDQLYSLANETDMAGYVSLTSQRGLKVDLPPIEKQRSIAHILGSLDDKIELNRQMNATLEGMAQALFKSWFVDFDPVIDNALAAGNPIPEAFAARAETRRKALAHGTANRDVAKQFPAAFQFTEEMGWIPEGWEMAKLSELLEVKYGKAHKNLSEGHIPVYGSGGLMRHADKSLYEGESVLIPRKGTLSNILYLNEEFWTVDTMFYTIPKIKFTPKYIFYHLKALDFESMNVGSAVPSMTTKVLNELLILMPEKMMLQNFDVILNSYFLKIRANNTQSKTLSNLRDTLLPKLISGEIRIPEAEKLTEEALA